MKFLLLLFLASNVAAMEEFSGTSVSSSSLIGSFVRISGDNMTGQLTLNGSTLTINGQDASGYSLSLSSSAHIRCIDFTGDGTKLCSANMVSGGSSVISSFTFTSTITIIASDVAGYSLKTSSGINMGGCLKFGDGTVQCTASSGQTFIVIASSSNGNYLVGVNDAGALTTVPTALSQIQLILSSPSNGNYLVGVTNPGALTTVSTAGTAGSNPYLVSINGFRYQLGVANNGALTTTYSP